MLLYSSSMIAYNKIAATIWATKSGITKCDKNGITKVWQNELESVLGCTKCGGITKWVSTTNIDDLKIR